MAKDLLPEFNPMFMLKNCQLPVETVTVPPSLMALPDTVLSLLPLFTVMALAVKFVECIGIHAVDTRRVENQGACLPLGLVREPGEPPIVHAFGGRPVAAGCSAGPRGLGLRAVGSYERRGGGDDEGWDVFFHDIGGCDGLRVPE